MGPPNYARHAVEMIRPLSQLAPERGSHRDLASVAVRPGCLFQETPGLSPPNTNTLQATLALV